MKIDVLRAKDLVLNDYFWRSTDKFLISIDRQKVREICNLFILFEKRTRKMSTKYDGSFNDSERKYDYFADLRNEVWREHYKDLLIDFYKDRIFNGELRAYWSKKIELNE